MNGGAGAAGESCAGCGRRHPEPATEVWVADGALEQLGERAGRAGWRRLVVVADATTVEVLGRRVADDLAAAGHEVERVTFPERHGLLADEAAVEVVRRAVAGGDPAAAGPARAGSAADGTPGEQPGTVAVAVGSGTLTDITRYASFLEDRPFCCVPTAASMDGYASSVAAMQFGGLKVTFPAHAPLGIYAEPAIVAAAPAEMTVWGLGDLLAKASASFDWRLGHGVTGEAYCPAIEERVLGPLRRCCDEVEAILAGGEGSVAVLLAGLVESGTAMAMQGSSRPASGSEHHCSHFWDLLAFRGLREHGPHGLQTGYATRLTTRLQASLLSELELPLRIVPGHVEPGAQRWLGPDTPQLAAVRAAKADAYAAYAPRWPPPDTRLAALRTSLTESSRLFERVGDALSRSGVPGPSADNRVSARVPILGLDTASSRATVRYANRLRDRVTVLDVLESQGVLEDQIKALFDPERG